MRLKLTCLLSGILLVLAAATGCGRESETAATTATATGEIAPSGSGQPVDPYQLLQKASMFLQQTDSFSCTMTSIITVAQEGMENRTKSTYEMRIERPNRLAIIGVSGANPITIVSNGDALIQYIPALERYSSTEPLNDFRGIQRGGGPEALTMLGPGASVLPLGGQRYLERLMQGVVSSQHVGDADADGTPCHLCEFKQADMSWKIAIQQGEEPLIRWVEFDFSSQMAAAEGTSYSTKVEYSDWDVKARFEPQAFAFVAPESATEVTSIMNPMSDSLLEESMEEIELPPIVVSPDAITAAEHVQAIYSFQRRMLVDAFNEVGIHDENLDERIVEFLDQLAHNLASDGKAESLSKLVDRVEALVSEGCEDPMVKMYYAMLIRDINDGRKPMEELVAIVEESYEGLVSRKYPEYRKLSAASWLWAYRVQTEDPRAGESLNLVGKHAILTIRGVSQDSSDARVVVARMRELVSGMTIEQHEKLYNAAKRFEQQQGWIVNVLGGDYFLAKAWDSRGSGWGSEVTDEGGAGFERNLVFATERYERAWKANPERPEPATKMVTVAKAQSSVPKMHMWFDRAVAGQIDWLPAYYAMFDGLMPRWFGSHQRMYQFGLECMKTERYDTDVPFMLLAALWMIQRDEQNPLGTRYWQKPGVYENVRAVTDRYTAMESKTESQINWWKTAALGAAVYSEKWDDAKSLVADLGDDIDEEALQRFALSKARVIASVKQAETSAP